MYKSSKFIAVFFLCTLLHSCNATTEKRLGMHGNTFLPCPSSPNCVSSMSKDSGHSVKPIPYSNIPMQSAKAALIKVLNKEKSCEIVSEKKHYIHAKFKSKVFGFIDDIEFYFPPNKKLIHVKSASRSGYYDFEKNRERVRRIANALTYPVK